MIYNIFIWKSFLFQLQQHIKHWAKPAEGGEPVVLTSDGIYTHGALQP